MSLKNNIKLLNSYKSRSNPNNDKIDSIINLYKEKKIPNIKTAENVIVLLTSKHKATLEKALDTYEQIFDKYNDAETITGRSTREGFLNVEKHNFTNPVTHIQININTRKNDRFDGVRDGAEKLAFDEIFKRTRPRLIDETTEMFNHKKSMTLRLGVKFEVGKLELDPFEEEEED
jgi:hypothetical protein